MHLDVELSSAPELDTLTSSLVSPASAPLLKPAIHVETPTASLRPSAKTVRTFELALSELAWRCLEV